MLLLCKDEVACFASEIYVKGCKIFSMSMKNEILLLVIYTIKDSTDCAQRWGGK